MPIIHITPADFSRINWRAIEEHIAAQRETVHTDILLFTGRSSNSWMADLDPYVPSNQAKLAIACQFWLDHRSRRKRPKLTDPDRAAYFTPQERTFLEYFLGTITNQPWLNLKAIWLKSEPGLITIHFKVYDYEPFLKVKATAPL